MQLLDHQKNSLELFLESGKRGMCLYHDTGTGKTYTTLSILQALDIKEAVIVVPNNQVANEWIAQNFTGVKLHFTTYACIGKMIVREDLQGVSAIVFDESHKIKSPKSARTRLAIMLVNKFRGCYRFLLSATPITLNELDFITQLKIASCGKFFEGKSFYAIRRMYFINTAPPTVKWQRWIINPKLKQEFYEEINKYSSFISREDLDLGLPDKHTKIVEYGSSVKELYKDLLVRKKDSEEVLELLRGYDSVNELTLLSVAHKLMIMDEERFKKLKEVLEEHKDKKIIVWSYYRDSYALIEKVIKEIGLRLSGIVYGGVGNLIKNRVVQDFKTFEGASVLVASIGTLSEGVNLQTAQVSIFFDLSYNYADIYQAQARNYRFGSPYKDVYEYFFKSDLSLDHVLYKNFIGKLSQDPKQIYRTMMEEKT